MIFQAMMAYTAKQFRSRSSVSKYLFSMRQPDFSVLKIDLDLPTLGVIVNNLLHLCRDYQWATWLPATIEWEWHLLAESILPRALDSM